MSEQAVNYRIIQAVELDAFRGKVIEALLDGWYLQGGVAVTPYGDGEDYFYSQAVARVVREDES